MIITHCYKFFMVAVLILIGLPAYATRGLVSDYADPHPTTFQNQETFEDIKVKVVGGHIRITRIWKGTDWAWNEPWNDLTFRDLATTPPDSGEQSAPVEMLMIYRAGQVYRKISGSASVAKFENQLNQFITKTTTGYLWEDRNGNGIRYNLDGKIIGYYDRNNVQVYIERDSNGYITQVLDHNNNTALSYSYETIPGAEPLTNSAGQLYYPQRQTKLTDYSGRAISYYWNDENQLEKITDVRGKDWLIAYADDGSLLKITDPNGRATHYQVQLDGRFISRTNDDSVGEKYEYQYDKDLKQYVTTKIDTAGVVTETRHNSIGQVESVRRNGFFVLAQKHIASDNSQGGENIAKAYSSRVEYWYKGGRLVNIIRIGSPGQAFTQPDRIFNKFTSITDAQGNITRYEFDQWKNVLEIVYPDGTTNYFTWHPKYSLPLTAIDAKGTKTTFEYDANGNLLTLIEATGTANQRVTRISYDAFGQVKTFTTGESSANNTALATTTFDYDQYGNILQIIFPEGQLTKFGSYDALGNPGVLVDGRANLLPSSETYSWVNSYDASGNLLSSKNPYGTGETYTYDDTGDLQSVSQASGNQWQVASNTNGKPLTLTDPNNKITRFEYDKADRLVNSTDANGNKRRLVYEADGKISAMVDGESNLTKYNYSNNLIQSIQYPTYKEFFDYDNRNRIKTATQQANSRNYVRKLGYDKNGNAAEATDANDIATLYEYDVFDRVIKITDADQGITEFLYDARDNLLQVKDPEGRLTLYTYDKNDRVLAETKSGDQNTNRQRVYGYDANNNLTQTLTPEQEKTIYEYDRADRVVKKQVFAHKDHSKPLKVVNFQFNEKDEFTGWDQHVSAELPVSVLPTSDIIPLSEAYTYNNLDELESVTVNVGGFSKKYIYTYYPNGLKKSYTNPEGIIYTYYYNKNNQLIAVHIPNDGQISFANFFWYAPQTLLLPGGQKITLKYNDFLQVKERYLKDSTDQSLASALYEYDLEFNIKKITQGEGDFVFGYDNLYRLTSADVPDSLAINDENYQYDGVGNRTHLRESLGQSEQNQTLTYNEKNQLVATSNNASFTYNANGHTKTKNENGVITEYIYNHEERLIEVKRAGNLLATYAYNPQGQRVKKTANGFTTWYLYNENGLAAEYSATGQLLKEYHFHPQKTWMTDPLFMRTAANDLYYYHNDQLGTPQELINSTGQIVWQANYSAFGQATVTTNTIENNLRFPGQYFDAETGLHQNYFRDYDPGLGRYIQRDPIGFDGGINFYNYANVNPLVFYDMNGEFPVIFIYKFLEGVATDLAIQIALNSFKGNGLNCIKLDSLIIAGFTNIINPFSPFGSKGFLNTFLKGDTHRLVGLIKKSKGISGVKRHNRKYKKLFSRGYREMWWYLGIEGGSEVLENVVPDWRPWQQ